MAKATYRIKRFFEAYGFIGLESLIIMPEIMLADMQAVMRTHILRYNDEVRGERRRSEKGGSQ